MQKIIQISIILLCSLFSQSQTIYFSGLIDDSTTWDYDTVKITGEVSVHASLIIMPGTYIEFQGHYKFKIYRSFKAIGTVADSIIFSINDTTGFHIIDSTFGGWHGLRFLGGYNDTSEVAFCKIEFAKGTDGLAGYNQDDMGSAIYCGNSNLIVSNCLIENNNSVASGAICFENNYDYKCNLVINNLIRKNSTLFNGGGVYSYFSSPRIINNIIYGNIALDGGGGILCSGSNVLISSNIISNNQSNYWGGGVRISYGSTASIINNIISNNGSGGIYVSQSDIFLINNTVCNNSAINSGGGLAVKNSPTNVYAYNTILWGNSAPVGNQVGIWYSNETNFLNCNIEGDSSGFYLYNGVFNGIYNDNINEDPQFNLPSSGSGLLYNGLNADWSLNSNSLCINNGYPDTNGLHLPEADVYGNNRIVGSIIDIGAVESQVIPHIADIKMDNSIRLYPNPTNEYINIEYWIGEDKSIDLQITDLNGNILFEENAHCYKNIYKRTISLSDLKSGVYFVKIKSGDKSIIKQLIKI